MAPAWLDPRPPAPSTHPAARGRASGRRLVFFDNGKLSPPYQHWLPIEAPLVASMRTLGDVERDGCDLLFESPARRAQRVAAWKQGGIDGIVFALCDAGVTQPTLALAAAAEQAGIPTAVLVLRSVLDLASACAAFLVPGMPLVELTAGRLDDLDSLGSAAETAAVQVVRALCHQPTAPPQLGLSRPPKPEPFDDFDEYARRRHLTDGLPVRLPTPERVQALLAATSGADEVLHPSLSPSGAALTLHGAAICAAMAGCEPGQFRFVLAALRAMAQPGYQLPLASITTHPGANLLLFSGPAARQAGIASGRGCLGPGYPANAAIGRAVGLALQNVGRAIPGLSALSTQGSPAQWACCFSDRCDTDLPPLNVVLGHGNQTVAWVQKAGAPHNVIDHLSSTPESLLRTIASVAATAGGNNAFLPSDLLVILNPEHARICTRAGWNRAAIQQYLWEQARNPRENLQGRGVKGEWPEHWKDWPLLPVAPSPDRIWIVVAGENGPQSQVAIPWGYAQAQWTLVEH